MLTFFRQPLQSISVFLHWFHRLMIVSRLVFLLLTHLLSPTTRLSNPLARRLRPIYSEESVISMGLRSSTKALHSNGIKKTIMILTETGHRTFNKEQGSPNLGPCSLLPLVVASFQGDFIGSVPFHCWCPTFTQLILRDEGFHLLHIGQWDNDLSLEILKDWIDLIDENGWVAREQILGDEARSRVPPEFQTQVPTFANPPTLTMAVTAFIERLTAQNDGPSAADLGMDFAMGSEQVPLTGFIRSTQKGSKYLSYHDGLDFLRSIYVPLRRHYDWFRRTQRGQIKQYGRKARSRSEAYRWRGRSETHVLTSGMDDYPRGPPHAGELHLDLISWMGFFTRTMRGIAEFIGETEDVESFKEIEKAIIENIDGMVFQPSEAC